MELQQIYFILGSLGGGYVIFLILLNILPKRLHSENRSQRQEILNEAEKQVQAIKKDSLATCVEELQILEEELADNIAESKENLKIAQEEINSEESSIRFEESRLQKVQKSHQALSDRISGVKKQLEAKEEDLERVKSDLVAALKVKANSEGDDIVSKIKKDLIEARYLETQKWLRHSEEDFNSYLSKFSNRMLSRALSRYAPDFPWPKAINHLDIQDKNTLEKLEGEISGFLANISELAGIELTLINEGKPHVAPSIKFAGGAGIDKEAARLATQEVLRKHPNQWSNLIESAFRKHRGDLEKRAIFLGELAVRELELEEIHEEIMKLVGYLNWRTSYRQNQFLHSLEVAKLAGILAFELGEDESKAKRCGLLHDIGKALDYRIEGSHAVISGDYADRFGEDKLICDTVMSHHDDLIVETPLAHILKTADTLSGARPGARVNLEEGYQVRLTAIDEVVNSFPGVMKTTIMNGGREVHVEVNHKRVKDKDLEKLSAEIARKIESEVAFPGQIKVLVSRRFEVVSVA